MEPTGQLVAASFRDAIDLVQTELNNASTDPRISDAAIRVKATELSCLKKNYKMLVDGTSYANT